MKKSLVALAVLAASGAAMAQVSITGNLTAGFRSTDDGNGNMASGFGVDKADIVFSAKEDLGGGMKASAKLGLTNVARGQAAQGVNNNIATNQKLGFGAGDTELALSGAFGQLSLSNALRADYLSEGVAGVGGNSMVERVFGPRVVTDSVAYTFPMGPVSFGLTYSEAPDRLGLGDGSSGASTVGSDVGVFGARQVALSLQYTDGPLVADVGYLTNDKLATYATFNNVENKNHLRGSISYDFGVVKVGGGMERQSWEGSNAKVTATDTLLAVSVPVGALTLSANWAQRELADTKDSKINGSNNGYGLKAQYALSKRTAFSVDYTNWKGRTNLQINDKNQSEYNLLLSHSF